jgi:serine protease Do
LGRITIEVLREGKKEVLKAHISEMKDDSAKKKQEKPKTNELGLAVENVTSEEVRGLEIPKGARGVIVTFVTPSSVADKAGLSRGDVIEEIANQPITSTEEFEKAQESKEGQRSF